ALIIKKPHPVTRYFTRGHSNLAAHLRIMKGHYSHVAYPRFFILTNSPFFAIHGREDFSSLCEANCRLAALTYPMTCRIAGISKPHVRGLRRPITFYRKSSRVHLEQRYIF